MKILYLLFLTFCKNTKDQTMYFKIINYGNNKNCVEAITTKEKAYKFNATEGNCNENNCKEYQGQSYIPLIGLVKGYKC